jgi:3-deoxy-D-manno-octulosonic-acid transferase
MLFYRVISIILLPLIALYILIRAIRGREDKNRIKERFAIASRARPNQKIIWMHAVSVGESNSALILLDYLLKTDSNIVVVFTTTSLTSAKLLEKRIASTKNYSNRVIHQFLPVDSYFCIISFLKYWRPCLTLLVESEIWPNIIYECSKVGSKVVLINGRISKKSFNYWFIFKKLGLNIFDHFKLIFAQSLESKKYFQQLTSKEIIYYGNLKSAAATLEGDLKQLEELKKQIRNRKIWLAASTHEGEEEVIFRTHQKLKADFSDILTIIVPRHPKRAAKIIESLPADLKIAQRSRGQQITSQTDIYLADTLGELGLFYRLSKISFIGGSLIDGIGGHNSFEAAKLSCGIISGKFIANNYSTYQQLEAAQACFMIGNEEQLAKLVKNLLLNPQLLEDTANNAVKLMNSYDQIPQKIINHLKQLF